MDSALRTALLAALRCRMSGTRALLLSRSGVFALHSIAFNATAQARVRVWSMVSFGEEIGERMIETTTATPHALPEEQLNRYLYGSDPTERIVAVERGGPDRMRVYRRVDGSVVEERVTFRPWLLMTTEPAWPDLAANLRTPRLEGEGDFCWFVECRTWPAYQDLRSRL